MRTISLPIAPFGNALDARAIPRGTEIVCRSAEGIKLCKNGDKLRFMSCAASGEVRGSRVAYCARDWRCVSTAGGCADIGFC